LKLKRPVKTGLFNLLQLIKDKEEAYSFGFNVAQRVCV